MCKIKEKTPNLNVVAIIGQELDLSPCNYWFDDVKNKPVHNLKALIKEYM